jgi:glycosyltransferase involved in cell wall biosynthesis
MGETPQARPPREAPESATISMVSVGSVLQSKGPQVLAQALQIASARTTSRLCLTWFGKVYERLDASLQAVAAVERLVADSGGSFEWIWAGHVGDVRDHLSAYDFLVHPSLSEGFPNAICEALAAGLPVVATDVGDARYLVTSSGAGIVVEPGSPELLADAILQASQCGVECLADMGLKGADYARNRLSIERMSHEFERLIDEASRS